MGTLLLDAGIPLSRCYEELCVTDPERIKNIHRQYIGAGARVIETNTFGGNAVRNAMMLFHTYNKEPFRQRVRAFLQAADNKRG